MFQTPFPEPHADHGEPDVGEASSRPGSEPVPRLSVLWRVRQCRYDISSRALPNDHMVLAITTAPTSDLRILSQRARPRSTEPMNDNDPPSDNLALTTEIVAAYVANHAIAPADLPALITTVFRSLGDAGRVGEASPASPARPEPAVPVRKSVQREFIVCLEDGKKVKTLKRYLATRHNLTPAKYRQRWGLPDDYPMVAPAYAEFRSTFALQSGLGRKPAARPAEPEPAPVSEAAPAPAQQRRTGGRRKAAA